MLRLCGQFAAHSRVQARMNHGADWIWSQAEEVGTYWTKKEIACLMDGLMRQETLKMKRLCNVGRIRGLIGETLRVLNLELQCEELIPEHQRNQCLPVMVVVIFVHVMIGSTIG